MQKWYENRTSLNTLIFLMVASFISYYFFQWRWGMPLFLILGTAIMVRGVIRITMRMRSNKSNNDSDNKEIE